ncbi:hypothetical protein [Burkholderia gladioli]|uniref:hypothetical protein n=1 Tax=Burkholderia gladioli TaxID=28095 RepID=UPI0016417AF4|nr:hypothetical protein [Burkholderia gladioli]
MLRDYFFSLLLSACSEKSMDVAIYNYWPRPIMDVSVNGQYAGGSFGEYHPGGVGGKVICCVKVKQGPVSVAWTLDGPPNAPGNGTRIQVVAVIEHISSGAKVLTIHIYPDETVFAETSKEYVDERQRQFNGRK